MNLTLQLSWIQDGAKLVYGPVPVRTGRDGYETRTGLKKIYWRNIDHVSSIYNVPMPYAQFFDGGQAFHSVGVSMWNPPGSHGCINMTKTDAKKYWSLLKNGRRRLRVRPQAGHLTGNQEPGPSTAAGRHASGASPKSGIVQPDPALPRGLVRDDARQGVAGRHPGVHRGQGAGVDGGDEVVHEEVVAALVAVGQLRRTPAAAATGRAPAPSPEVKASRSAGRDVLERRIVGGQGGLGLQVARVMSVHPLLVLPEG